MEWTRETVEELQDSKATRKKLNEMMKAYSSVKKTPNRRSGGGVMILLESFVGQCKLRV